MRICFLAHNLKQDNGGGVFSSRLINELRAALGADAMIFTYPIKFFELRRAIKQCDAVHALDVWPYAILAYLASFGFKKKFIITAAGSAAIISLYNFWQAWITKRAYRAADKVIAISKFTKDEILKKVPDLKIEVINHGVDYEKYYANDGGSNVLLSGFDAMSGHCSSVARERMSITLSEPSWGERGKRNSTLLPANLKHYILSVGSLRWRKGYHRSLPAFAEIAKVFPSLKYVIVGKRYKDDYYNRLKLAVGDLKLEGKVVILDNIDDESALIQLYKNAELFCMMPQTAGHDLEGFGLVFLEAAAAGLPVVGTSGSGVEDAVLNGKNGILIDDPRDSKGFADAVIKILSDANLKKSMSQNSLEWAQKFSWASKIAEYKKIYEFLL